MHGFYFLYKRQLKTGIIYYYKAYKPDGSLSTGKTTGCRSKRIAKIYCDTLLKEGKLSYTTGCSFSQYATHFFDDDSIWVMDRKSLGTASRPAISESYLKKLKRTVKIHLLPFFGKKRLNSITPSDIKAYRLHLLKERGLSCKSINDTVSVLKTRTSRIVPIIPELYELLNGLAEKDFVFEGVREGVPSNELRKLLKQIMPEKRKANGYCLHSFRHFCNTQMLSENVTPVKVAAVLGHSTGISSMQERYTNFTEADYQEVFEVQKKLFNELKYW